MNKDELIDFLLTNLRIEAEIASVAWGSGDNLKVSLYLGDSLVSYDYVHIEKSS